MTPPAARRSALLLLPLLPLAPLLIPVVVAPLLIPVVVAGLLAPEPARLTYCICRHRERGGGESANLVG